MPVGKLYDRGGMAVTTSGTGTTLSLGSALVTSSIYPSALATFANAGAQNNDTLKVLIIDTGNAWEISWCNYNSSGPSLINRTLVASSTGSLLSLSGSAQAFIMADAADLVTTALIPGGFLNKFRNGTMDVWQRGTASITVSTSGAYVADGWIVVPAGASVTAQQASGRALTVNSLKVTGNTSVTDVIVKQRIESYLAAPLTSQIVTVQAQIYNGTGASITPTLTVKHAGSQDVWTSPTTDVSAVSLQACANSAWTLVAYTFTASASAATGLEISFDFGNNFSANTKSIQITECDVRVTPGVATGSNSNPPIQELRPVHTELTFCQRYFATSYVNGTAQGAATKAGVVLIGQTAATMVTADNLPIPVELPAQMRAAPTVTYWDGAGNASKATYIQDATTFTDNNAVANGPFNISASSFMMLPNAITNTMWLVHYAATAEL